MDIFRTYFCRWVFTGYVLEMGLNADMVDSVGPAKSHVPKIDLVYEQHYSNICSSFIL